MGNVDPGSFFYLLLLIVPLIYLPRFLQREIQSIFLLITHRPEISMVLFSLLFFPGIFLHESSHFVMARLLGVRTGRFSIIPKKLEGRKLQLGYVETASTDFVRDALIGVAPLIAGGLFVGFIGVTCLEINTVWESLAQGQALSLRMTVSTITNQPDFWIWFYLVFAVSSTMMPSSSDRKSWLPVILLIAVTLGLIILIGAGSWLLTELGTVIKSATDAVTIVFMLTVVIHIFLYPPAWLIRKFLSRLMGLQVV